MLSPLQAGQNREAILSHEAHWHTRSARACRRAVGPPYRLFRRRFTIGRYGALIVEEARIDAKKILGSVARVPISSRSCGMFELATLRKMRKSAPALVIVNGGSVQPLVGVALAVLQSLQRDDGHSTCIYAHMQQDSARRAAVRVVGPIATALGVRVEAEVIEIGSKKTG